MSKSYILYFFGFGKSLSEAAQIMLEGGVDTMPVLENDKLVGMIIERDFFKLVTWWIYKGFDKLTFLKVDACQSTQSFIMPKSVSEEVLLKQDLPSMKEK